MEHLQVSEVLWNPNFDWSEELGWKTVVEKGHHKPISIILTPYEKTWVVV